MTSMTNVERFAVKYWVVWYEAMAHGSTETEYDLAYKSMDKK